MKLRVRCLAIVMWTGTMSAEAQLPAVGVPKGLVRIEADGLFEAFDERFRDGTRESYGADLSSDALGGDRIPALGAVNTRLGRIIGSSDFQLDLGRLSSSAHADISTIRLGLSYGLGERITVFGRIPLSRTRTQSHTRLDPTGANAGLVPLPTDQAGFFDQFDDALGTLRSKIDAGDYDASPATKALAEATLAGGTSLQGDLFAILGAPDLSAPFAPTASSAAGAAISGQITTLQNTLSTDLGVAGFTTMPTLPAEPLNAATFESFLDNGLGFRAGQTELRFRGDAELGATYTLADRWNRGENFGGFRAAVSALLRLPTGTRDQQDRILDLGSGDGQTDVEIAIVTDVAGERWGARLTGMYTRQLPADVTRRVSSPAEPYVGPERLATVRRDPGDVVAISVRPFYRLAGALALQAGLDHWRRGADDARYASAAGALPGVDARILTIGSQASATLLGVGVTYANLGRLRPGGTGLPVEASWMFERVMRAGEGVVPAIQQVRGSLRLYVNPFN